MPCFFRALSSSIVRYDDLWNELFAWISVLSGRVPINTTIDLSSFFSFQNRLHLTGYVYSFGVLRSFLTNKDPDFGYPTLRRKMSSSKSADYREYIRSAGMQHLLKVSDEVICSTVITFWIENKNLPGSLRASILTRQNAKLELERYWTSFQQRQQCNVKARRLVNTKTLCEQHTGFEY